MEIRKDSDLKLHSKLAQLENLHGHLKKAGRNFNHRRPVVKDTVLYENPQLALISGCLSKNTAVKTELVSHRRHNSALLFEI